MPLPYALFDLSGFPYANLFLLEKPVWETLQCLKEFLDSIELGSIHCEIPSSTTLIHPEKISIGKGTIVEPGAFIEGPCLIGENCQIRHGAYLRPYVFAADRCILGHASEFKCAILLEGAAAPHFNYVGDSILGRDVNLGAGAICANFRLDHKEIIVKIGKSCYKTGTNKFGTAIGDESQLGCNSVVNPGVILRKKTYSLPCTFLDQSNLRCHGPYKAKLFSS